MKGVAFAAALLASAATCSKPSNPPAQRMEVTDQVNFTSAAGALRYCTPGDLMGPGEAGYTGRRVFFPEIIFPIDFEPDTHQVSANSQMYNSGGYCFGGVCGKGGGSSCVRDNFTRHWQDTFCEEAGRTYKTLMCPDGRGHQGVDVRPPVAISDDGEVCRSDFWAAVALVDGEVTRARGAVVTIVDAGGREFTYRHLNPTSIRELGIRRGSKLKRGDPVGRLDQFNNSGTVRYTTLHLHLEALSQAPDGATVFFPVYTSLVAAYRQKIGLPDLIDRSGALSVDRGRELGQGCR